MELSRDTRTYCSLRFGPLDPRRRHQAPLRLLAGKLAVPHEVVTQAGFDITIATPGTARPVADEAGVTPEMNGGATEPGERNWSYTYRLPSTVTALLPCATIPSDGDRISSPITAPWAR